jgi:hypothetical protein
VARFDREDVLPVVIVAIVAAFLLFCCYKLIIDEPIFGKTAAAAESFDHSGCQYPYRTTNPPNGCDNSDPCDPTKTKGGSGDCDDVTPIPPIQSPPASSHEVEKPPTVVNCTESK